MRAAVFRLCLCVYECSWWDRVNLIAKIVRLARTIHIKLCCLLRFILVFLSAVRMDFFVSLSSCVHVFVSVCVCECHWVVMFLFGIFLPFLVRIVAYLVLFSLKVYFFTIFWFLTAVLFLYRFVCVCLCECMFLLCFLL